MFPIRDHNPSGRTPYVTYALIAANVVFFILYYPLFSDQYQLALFWQDWAMVPSEVADGRNVHTLFTAMFLHGGVMHLLGNMLFLWIFGDNMEDAFGHTVFLMFYLVCGICASFGQIIFDPASNIPNVGASGAIAGVLGGYLLLYPKARVDVLLIFVIFFKIFTLRAWIVLGFWFGVQIFQGVASGPIEGSGVAYWAHSGGFVAGLALTLPLWLLRGGTTFWKTTGGHPPTPETHYPEHMTRVPVVRRNKRNK